VSDPRIPRTLASSPKQSNRLRWILLGLLLAAGAYFLLDQPFDRMEALALGASLAESPWTAVLLVLALILLLALGLPGTLMVWLIAPFYPPLIATALMLTGSVIGAAAAYTIAGFLGMGVYQRFSRHQTFRILASRSDFFTQTALRVLPGFPHAIVNYSAGMLRLPRITFLLAAVLGLAVKWAVYCWSINTLFRAGLEGEGPGATALWLLALLTGLLGLGSWTTARLKARAAARAD
jgi:uncharacterized membrane protein YdjX (TVP38/TMEM64 family)